MNSGKLLIGILAGAAIGALAGILLAPEKGSDTREKILKKGEGLVDEIKEKFTGLINEVTNNIDKAKEV